MQRWRSTSISAMETLMTTDATLAPSEIARYARHIVLPEIGGPGQQKLKAARVLVIGAGGLGAPALQYLAAAGVGTLGIVDDDVVSLSNLQRQVIHATADIGRPKVDSAAAAIDALNPHDRAWRSRCGRLASPLARHRPHLPTARRPRWR